MIIYDDIKKNRIYVKFYKMDFNQFIVFHVFFNPITIYEILNDFCEKIT